MIVAVCYAFAVAGRWAGTNPLRIAFVIAAGAITFQIAVLIKMARDR